MKKVITILIAAVLLLTACSSSSTPIPSPAATASQGLPQSGGSQVPAPTKSTSSSTGIVLFHIVPDKSKVTYEAKETLISQNNVLNTAIGSTNQISGTINVDTQNPLNSSVGPLTVDISTLKSDKERRDSSIQGRFLESSKFPIATFKPAQVSGLPASYTLGQEISFQVTGDLTIRDVTRPATFNITGVMNQGSITGQAVTTIKMSDYGFGPISIAGILNTQDDVKVTVDFVAEP